MLDPESEEARSQLDRYAQRFATMATSAAQEGQIPLALDYLETAIEANPSHTDLAEVREEVRQAETFQAKIDEMVQSASSYRLAGQLVSPPGENAATVYMDVLALQPDNQIAVNGLAEVDTQVLASFLNLLDERDFSGVDDLIANSLSVGLKSQSIAQMEDRLAEEKLKISRANELYVEALGFFELGYITAPAEENVVEKLREALLLDPTNDRAIELMKRSASRLAQVAYDAHNQGMHEAARAYIDLALQLDPDAENWLDSRNEWSAELVSTTNEPSLVNGE